MKTPIWFEPLSLETLEERSQASLASHLAIKFISHDDHSLSATMPVDHTTKQPMGLLNGGASCALAETVGSTAANFCVDQSQYYCVGLDINANHVRPVREGLVTAVAKPIHLGSKTQVWEILISDDQGRLACVSRLTMMVIAKSS